MLNKILFWLNNARLFSLPMTLMSWIIIFTYSLKEGGNVINGILALIGIAFAHLATNLFDDYIDYKTLSTNKEFMENTVKSKCSYIKDGKATPNDLLKVVMFFCGISFLIGVILTIRCGWEIVGLAIIGGIITLSYAKLSSNGLSELAVGTAFGPLLFEGVYFVMTGRFSIEVFILSIAVVVFTIGLLYVHNLLDFDGDMCAHKKTLCCRIGNKNKALNLLILLYGLGYVMCFVLCFIGRNIFYLLPTITVPLAIMLFVWVKMYNNNSQSLPAIKWWYYPLDNWDKVKQEGTESFYLRLYQARNLMVWFSVLMLIAILLTK